MLDFMKSIKNIIFSHYLIQPLNILWLMGNQQIKKRKYFIMTVLFLEQILSFFLRILIKKELSLQIKKIVKEKVLELEDLVQG